MITAFILRESGKTVEMEIDHLLTYFSNYRWSSVLIGLKQTGAVIGSLEQILLIL